MKHVNVSFILRSQLPGGDSHRTCRGSTPHPTITDPSWPPGPALLGSSPFFLPTRWATAPGLLISGWPPLPLFAFLAFKTPGDELPLFNPGTRFWSGTWTFSATQRLRRQQENRGLGPSLLWVPCNAVWALPPQTQGWWPPFLLQPATGPGVVRGPWEAGHAPAGGRGTSRWDATVCHVGLHPLGLGLHLRAWGAQQ